MPYPGLEDSCECVDHETAGVWQSFQLLLPGNAALPDSGDRTISESATVRPPCQLKILTGERLNLGMAPWARRKAAGLAVFKICTLRPRRDTRCSAVTSPRWRRPR